jgi:hypothetical protein
MSIYLTQLGSDNFQRANENPLSQGGNWTENPTPANYPLQIVGEQCVCTVGGPQDTQDGSIYSGVSLPADQYVAVTVGALKPDELESYIGPNLRFTAIPGQPFEDELSYMLWVSQGEWIVTGPTSPTDYNLQILGQGYGITVEVGDIITFAVIGTTLYFYQNTTLIWSGTDTNVVSGVSALAMQCDSSNTSLVSVSNFSVGSASLTQTPGSFTPGNLPPTPSSKGPFLGTVTTVSEAPISSDPFLGTIEVIDSPPSGVPASYLGAIRVVGSAPAGLKNPALGQVVVLTEAPSGVPDPYLGNVVES